MEKISFTCLLSNIRKNSFLAIYFASKKKPFIFCSNEAKIESCLTMEFGGGARPGD